MGFSDLFKTGGDTIKGAIEGVGEAAIDIRSAITGDLTPDKKAEVGLRLVEIEKAALNAQMEINKAEAQHSSVFVAGWRPFLGWVCSLAIAFAYLVRPILVGIIKAPVPEVDAGELYPLILGMLGLAVTRTVEKSQGTQGKH